MHYLITALIIVFAPAIILIGKMNLHRTGWSWIVFWLWAYGTLLAVIIVAFMLTILTWAPSWDAWKHYFSGMQSQFVATEWLQHKLNDMSNIIGMGFFVLALAPIVVVADILRAAFAINFVIFGIPLGLTVLWCLAYAISTLDDIFAGINEAYAELEAEAKARK